MPSQTWFEVRLKFYQFNSGKMDNGFVTRVKKFSHLNHAESYVEDINTIITNKESLFRAYSDFVDEFVSSGYLEDILGIWKVTYSEEKVS